MRLILWSAVNNFWDFWEYKYVEKSFEILKVIVFKENMKIITVNDEQIENLMEEFYMQFQS